jgi:hypothetical protein
MSMVITINRKTSMHLFVQRNSGICELFLAILPANGTQQSQKNQQMATRTWRIEMSVKTDLLCRGILYVMAGYRFGKIVFKRTERLWCFVYISR